MEQKPSPEKTTLYFIYVLPITTLIRALPLLFVTLLLTCLLVGCGSSNRVQPKQSPLPTPQASEPTPVPLESLPTEPPPETSSPTPPPTATIEPTTLPSSPTATTLPLTPAPPFEVISDKPLLSDDLLRQMGVDPQGYIPVSVVDWLTSDEVIVKVEDYPNVTYWRVSISQQQATPTTWERRKPSAEVIEEMSQISDKVKETGWALQVSPDGRWASWGLTRTLWLKKLGTHNPPEDLMAGDTPYRHADARKNFFAWSWQSDQVAYSVGGSVSNFEIRINKLNTQEQFIVTLPETPPSFLTWSPDGKYLVFRMSAQPRFGIDNMYLIEVGKPDFIPLLTHGQVDDIISWSPADDAIVYTNVKKLKPWLVTLKQSSEDR